MSAVDKKLLYPAAPPLTRFTECVMPAMKRKSLEFADPDNKMVTKLDELTIPKLCIRLNTLCVSFSLQAKTFVFFFSVKTKQNDFFFVCSVLMKPVYSETNQCNRRWHKEIFDTCPILS